MASTSASKTFDTEDSSTNISCPVCNRQFEKNVIEDHVNQCLFLNTAPGVSKRTGSNLQSPQKKRIKLGTTVGSKTIKEPQPSTTKLDTENNSLPTKLSKCPLAEHMRPVNLEDFIGQRESFGPGSMLRAMLEQKKIPNMILWGPPGCGKTSLANVIANICKQQPHMRYVKLSATMAGINDVKEVVKVAKNEAQFKRQTVLFMDEIHRFNKLQQDTFLPHVENGTIILIGATTENPSFSLNNALLSRCRVVVMEKLSADDVLVILERALDRSRLACVAEDYEKIENYMQSGEVLRCLVPRESLRWLAEVSDGDARTALGALELAIEARDPGLLDSGPAVLTLDDVKEGIKRSHTLYDRRGEEHYNTISAVHKSIRAGDDNAALYWTVRAMQGGEDPAFIARRLVRAAAEDIGLADPSALVEAVACLHGCKHVGMPESDVLLAQCAMRLARAPKSREVYDAMKRCQRSIAETKGPLPPVPLHLRNASTNLMKQIGYGRGYNLRHKDESGLSYMPEGLEHVDFFEDDHGAKLMKQIDTGTEIAEVKTKPSQSLEASDAATRDVYAELVELEQQALVSNVEPFECGICLEQCAPGAGCVLRECLHAFCRGCLGDWVRHCREPAVTCPAAPCPYMLQEREIRAVAGPLAYERWLALGLAAAESGARHAFHCRTRDCAGWALVEPPATRFPCPVCNRVNCVPCQAIHEDETCEEYRTRLQTAAASLAGETDKATRALIDKMISKGEALECPECTAIITKQWGCDWVKCSACKTEICWVTRGRRWGPAGPGDTSAGCRCRVGRGRRRCHPKCGNCH